METAYSTRGFCKKQQVRDVKELLSLTDDVPNKQLMSSPVHHQPSCPTQSSASNGSSGFEGVNVTDKAVLFPLGHLRTLGNVRMAQSHLPRQPLPPLLQQSQAGTSRPRGHCHGFERPATGLPRREIHCSHLPLHARLLPRDSLPATLFGRSGQAASCSDFGF